MLLMKSYNSVNQETATKHKEAIDQLTGDIEELRSQLVLVESSRQDAQEQLEEALTTNRLLEVLSRTPQDIYLYSFNLQPLCSVNYR